tara:strand:+ start:3793 stop:4617 length:825 start_codon:yes stop_codon:yes gene_type:complete
MPARLKTIVRPLLALLVVSSQLPAKEILVRSWAQEGYLRPSLEDGTKLEESYVFFKGEYYPGAYLENSEKGTSFLEVSSLLEEQLESRNYRLAKHPSAADFFLVIHWGELTPEADAFENDIEASFDDDLGYDANVFNMSGVAESAKRKNAQIIGTSSMYDMHVYSMKRQKLEEAVQIDRYFINIIAFATSEMKARGEGDSLPEPKWITQLSVPSSRQLEDAAAFDILAKTGAAYFGENVSDLDFMREGEKRGVVKIGELEFIESLPSEDSESSK